MRTGVTMMLSDRTIGVVELARAAEDRGFESLYLPEHTHLPVECTSRALVGDGSVGDEYARVPDPLVSLAAAAVGTSRIRLGTGVALVAQHDPIVLAKQVATLDQLSGGRIVLGVGYGWNAEELADHGVAFDDRRAVVHEHLAVMQRLWDDDIASFDGAFVTLSPSRAWPKPVQRPRVRTLIGGGPSAALFRAVATHADGWMPLGGRGLSSSIPALQDAFREAGRDPAHLDVVPFGTFPDREKLEYFRTLGVTEVALGLPASDEAETLRTLDAYAAIVEELAL
ncbi:MAG: LLM class F420-dependent oxidoreductase [Acidimicrobiia bacterium]